MRQRPSGSRRAAAKGAQARAALRHTFWGGDSLSFGASGFCGERLCLLPMDVLRKGVPQNVSVWRARRDQTTAARIRGRRD